MSASSPRKTHKRFAPSRAGSELSCSTVYSSSSTLFLEEWFLTPPDSSSNKPWAIKALNQLGMRCRKSMVFGKDKKKVEDKLDKEEEPYVSPYTKTPPPFVLDISKEAVARRKEKELEEEEDSELLPEAPQILRRAPSSNTLMQFERNSRRPSLSALRSGSTPDLRSTSKRDTSPGPDDPFYLERLLKEFPRPPVRNPGEYARREPVHPRVRRQNSNFSYPSSKAYPELAKSHAKQCIDRPVGRDAYVASPGEQPYFSDKSDRGFN